MDISKTEYTPKRALVSGLIHDLMLKGLKIPQEGIWKRSFCRFTATNRFVGWTGKHKTRSSGNPENRASRRSKNCMGGNEQRPCWYRRGLLRRCRCSWNLCQRRCFHRGMFWKLAPGINDEITSFCEMKNKTIFSTLGKIDVNGENADPFIKYTQRSCK